MADYRENYKSLSGNLNILDPIVRHDPTIGASPVMKFNKSERILSGQGGANTAEFDSKKVDGPRVPIIRIDSQVISMERIQKFHLDYKGFVPTCEVVVTQDENRDVERTEAAGMQSNMTVVMVPFVDGAYKSISVNFYITDVQYTEKTATYKGTYLLNKMEVPKTKQITFNPFPSSGCPAKYCQLGPNKYPTTFEFLHYVAVTECGLGFATTDKVKEIKDDKTRIVRNEKYVDAMQKHIAFGGLDADSVFDGWIDLYRYLVVVNFSWVMNYDLDANEIAMKPVNGPDFSSEFMPDAEQQGDMHRVITNYNRLETDSNMKIASWTWEVNNKDIYSKGTLNDYFIGTPTTTKGNNSIEATSIRLKDNSEKNDFAVAQFGSMEFCGYECGDETDHNTPVLMQKRIHDNMLMKFRSKRLVVTMNKPNFGLQRGTIINVVVFCYDPLNKRRMWANMNNLYGDTDPEAYPTDSKMEEVFNDPSVGLPDLSVTGFYYIDGMEFDYKNNENGTKDPEIVQKLFLIKKGYHLNYQNAVSVPKQYKKDVND